MVHLVTRNPSNVRLYTYESGGLQRLSSIERLCAIKEGANFLTNSELDWFLTSKKNGKNVPKALLETLTVSGMGPLVETRDGLAIPILKHNRVASGIFGTRTLLVVPGKDGIFGDTLTDSFNGITVIIPQLYRGEGGIGLGADLAKDNFKLGPIETRGTKARIEVAESAFRPIELLAPLEYGIATQESLGIPVKINGKDAKANCRFEVDDKPAAGLLVRSIPGFYSVGFGFTQGVSVLMPVYNISVEEFANDVKQLPLIASKDPDTWSPLDERVILRISKLLADEGPDVKSLVKALLAPHMSVVQENIDKLDKIIEGLDGHTELLAEAARDVRAMKARGVAIPESLSILFSLPESD